MPLMMADPLDASAGVPYDVLAELRDACPVSRTPASVTRGTSATLTIRGAWFGDNMVAKLGDGVDVVSVRLANPTKLLVEVSVSPTAATGLSPLFIANPGSGPGDSAGAATGCALCVSIE
jgi:Quinohemoprotein amine dehydrogenase, alpha subunit domain III